MTTDSKTTTTAISLDSLEAARKVGRVINSSPDYREEVLHEFFGRCSDSYNIDLDEDADCDDADDGSGRPGIGIAANALNFWVGQQYHTTTVGDAAVAFSMPAEAVAQAVRWHPWMLIGGDEALPLISRTIEQDGE